MDTTDLLIFILALTNLLSTFGLVRVSSHLSRPRKSGLHQKRLWQSPAAKHGGNQSISMADYDGPNSPSPARRPRATKEEQERKSRLQSLKVAVDSYRRGDGTRVVAHERTEEVRVPR